MKTLLLTGWTGYIGSHNAVLFLKQGYKIIILDNLSNSSEDVIQSIQTITWKTPIFYKGDLRNIWDIERVFLKHTIDIVIHFAGLKAVWDSCNKPFEYYENNIVGSMNLFQVMEQYKCKNIIFSSSATVYEPSQTPPFSEITLTWNTTNPYGTTKFIIENLLRDLANHKDFRVVNLRYFNPVGAHSSGLIGEDPNDIPNNLLPFIMKVATWELKELQVFGNDYDTIDGTGVRDYIHVVDLAIGHLKALEWLQKRVSFVEGDVWDTKTEEASGIFETFNLGTGNGTSVFEMIAYTESIIWKTLPHSIIERRTGDIASAYCSPKKAETILSWKTEKTVQEAINDSWKFIQNKQWK